jgi:methyl-accepting chemotaxis protein
VAASGAVIAAVTSRDHAALNKALATYLASHGLSSLVVTDAAAAVLLRAEDPERFGDSRSSDPLVRRALVGEGSASVVVKSGVVAPAVSLVAGAPIRDGSGAIIGTVVAGRAISNAFVDGIRASTGLESAVYGSATRAATTLTTTGSTDRAVGVKETTTAVVDQVLTHDRSYSGVVLLQNRPYLAAFTPLRNINNEPVGMLLVAHPEDELYSTANRSIQLTFLFVVALIVVSVYPVYLVSRFLSGQLK